jgi:hypothetical protein
MSQATPTNFSMVFKHTYSKMFSKFGGHSFNYFFVHGLAVSHDQRSRVMEVINKCVLECQLYFSFLKVGGHCEAMLDVTENIFINS